MSIWFSKPNLQDLNQFGRNSMIAHLGIQVTEIGDDYIRATMPVDERTVQAYGILHGGASVALAETIGSYAAILCVDHTQKRCVGLEINANHIKAVRSGIVTATARPAHLGRSTQVWEIKIYTEENKLVCISRLTVAVMNIEPERKI